MNADYIFYIEPYVYVNTGKNGIIFHNTLSNTTVKRDENTFLSKIINKILCDKNMHVTFLTKDEYFNKNFISLLKELKEKHMADAYLAKKNSQKPAQLKPFAKLEYPILDNQEINIPTDIYKTNLNILDYIKTVNLYVNNSDSKFPEAFETHKQLLWLKQKDSIEELACDSISNIVSFFSKSNVQFNIIGGNIFEHSKYAQIIDTMYLNKLNFSCYIHYKDICVSKIKDLLKLNASVNIMIDFRCGINNVLNKINMLQFEGNSKISFHLLIEGEQDYNLAESLISQTSFDNWLFKPYYTGENIKFFEDNVFIDSASLSKVKLSMRELLAKKIVNPVQYGNITIFPNGDLFSNVNHPKHGNTIDNSFLELISKSIIESKSYKHSRSMVEPCCDCIYADLCPPISNYEYVIGTYNLCEIYKKN